MKEIKKGISYNKLVEEIERKEEFGCWVVGKCIGYSENSCGIVKNLTGHEGTFNKFSEDQGYHPIAKIVGIFTSVAAVIVGMFCWKKRKNK